MPQEPVIEISSLSFSYGGAPVLDDVNLRVEARQMMSVVGPNGGGKTTLLKLILGLLQPKKGTVRVFDSAPRQSRHRIGYMPQYARFDPHFPVSVLEVVLMGRAERHFGGPYRRADKQAAHRALDEVGLSGAPERLFASLSGGQRQRVLIARALACDPDLLLLDEPTANVDASAESRFYEILRSLNERLTILIVSHDIGLVSGLAQQAICVNRRVAVHPTSELTGELLQEMYGTDRRFVHHNQSCDRTAHD